MLLKAQAKGIKLILASGRPTSGLLDLAKELEMDKNDGLLVSFNGSKVIDCQTFEELFNEPMSIEEGKAVLEHMKKFEVKLMVDKGEYMLVNNVFDNKIIDVDGREINIIEYESRGGKYKLCEIDDLAEYVDYPLNKILTAGQPQYLKEHYKEMMEPFKDTLSCMFTASFYFEFTANGIDKAKALDTVLKPMNINQDEIISFGDGQNDLSIIKYAGIGVSIKDETKTNLLNAILEGMKKVEYEVKTVSEDKEQATVDVSIKGIDMKKMTEDLQADVTKYVTENPTLSQDELLDYTFNKEAELIKNASISETAKTITITLTNEGNVWVPNESDMFKIGSSIMSN